MAFVCIKRDEGFSIINPAHVVRITQRREYPLGVVFACRLYLSNGQTLNVPGTACEIAKELVPLADSSRIRNFDKYEAQAKEMFREENAGGDQDLQVEGEKA